MTADEQEVLSGEEASRLPIGSLVQSTTGGPTALRAERGWFRTDSTWVEFGKSGQYRVLWRGEEKPPQVGDVVTGDRAVSLPIGTLLRETSSAVAALRVVDHWSITGWPSGPSQHTEHCVRTNRWRVVEVGDGALP